MHLNAREAERLQSTTLLPQLLSLQVTLQTHRVLLPLLPARHRVVQYVIDVHPQFALVAQPRAIDLLWPDSLWDSASKAQIESVDSY